MRKRKKLSESYIHIIDQIKDVVVNRIHVHNWSDQGCSCESYTHNWSDQGCSYESYTHNNWSDQGCICESYTHNWSDQGVVNRTWPSLIGGLLKITRRVQFNI